MISITSSRDRIPTRNIIDSTGVWCSLGYAGLAYVARQTGEPDLTLFYGIVAWTTVPVFALYLYLLRQEESFPFGRLIFWAIVFRLCGLFGGPFYEDDFYRYLWDGYRFWEAGTPYGVAPEAFFLDQGIPIALQEALHQINNPDLPTIYGPVTQLLFLLGYLLHAGNVIVLQALLITVDLAVIYLLTRLTNVRNALLYAWCPLVIKEIAFTAHPDSLAVCLVLTAIVLTMKERDGLSAVCLGFAVGAKLFALVLVPFVLCRTTPRCWLYFGVTLCLIYTPFLLTGATELDALIVFAREWEFNSSAFALVSLVTPPTIAKLLLAVVYGVFTIYYFHLYRRGKPVIPRGDWLFGALFILTPVFNPWYMLWVLPFAAIYPSRWAWTASSALLLSYITGLNLGNYELQAYAQPIWIRVTEFGAIAVAFVWDIQRQREKSRDEQD